MALLRSDPASIVAHIGLLLGLVLLGGLGCSSDATGSNDPVDPVDPGDVQPIEIVFAVTVPDDTPLDDSVYVTGDFQGWVPDAAASQLRRRSDGVYTATLTFTPRETVRFRFIRGDWPRVEVAADGFSIEDRTYVPNPSDEGQEVSFTVQAWADLAWPRATRAGRIEIWRPAAWPDRRVWTYLPPGYATSTDRYPVLYMLDGQNVFDLGTSFAGEWNVDETCEQLITTQQMRPLIVVAIDNGSEDRIAEYTPTADPTFGGGQGDAHLDRIIDDVKAEVDVRFRTLTGPETTGVAGSSLGGLMALYAAYTRGGTFGRAAALSPSLWWADRWIIDFIGARAKFEGPVYMDMGTLESGQGIADLRAMAEVLRSQGFVDEADLWVFEDPAGAHNELAWRRRFPDALRRLFPIP